MLSSTVKPVIPPARLKRPPEVACARLEPMIVLLLKVTPESELLEPFPSSHIAIDGQVEPQVVSWISKLLLAWAVVTSPSSPQRISCARESECQMMLLSNSKSEPQACETLLCAPALNDAAMKGPSKTLLSAMKPLTHSVCV